VEPAGTDQRLMARALRLARRGLFTTDPNPRVGCVIASQGAVVGEGYHARAGEAHAERVALDAAGGQAAGATAYVTLEPCCHQGRTPPCTAALIDAGIRRVVYALRDPDPRVAGRGFAELRAAGVEVEHLAGAASEARELNIGFVKRMTTGRPWVRAKLATSLDGRTALKSGESRWITAEAARADVHRWRARASCILTGVDTVVADDPRLDVRLGADGAAAPHQPALAILDSTLRTPADARVFDHHDRVMIFSVDPPSDRRARLEARGATVIETRADNGRPAMADVLQALGGAAVNELHVEAGARVCGSLLEAGCLDELLLYLAPQLLGAGARGAFDIADLGAMSQRVRLVWRDVRHVGGDLRIRALPVVDRDHERNA